MAKFEGVSINIKVGDIISSRYGFFVESLTTDVHYLAYRMEYLGNGIWKILSEKTPVYSEKTR